VDRLQNRVNQWVIQRLDMEHAMPDRKVKNVVVKHKGKPVAGGGKGVVKDKTAEIKSLKLERAVEWDSDGKTVYTLEGLEEGVNKKLFVDGTFHSDRGGTIHFKLK
jgi:hypothetical protein